MGCLVLLILAFLFRGAISQPAGLANRGGYCLVKIAAKFGILGLYRYSCVMRYCCGAKLGAELWSY